jgi:hypothetical protein
MNNYLDKLIGDDELLTYICLILAIFNILLISMIINDIENYFSIYIFILFVVLFLIFIVYFLLKKKDSDNKDDEIKYDWYFYLRISIIILVFLNFALYIYKISNDSSIDLSKNGGGGAFSRQGTKVSSIQSETETNTDDNINKKKRLLVKKLNEETARKILLVKGKQASEEYYITKENIRNPEIIKKKIAESKKSLKAEIDAIKKEKIQKRNQIIDDARKDISLSKISKKSWKTSRNNRVHPS